jgi:hypothetical protein
MRTYLNIDAIQTKSVDQNKLIPQIPDYRCNIIHVRNIPPGPIKDEKIIYTDGTLEISDKVFIGGTLNDNLITALTSEYDSENEAIEAVYDALGYDGTNETYFFVSLPYIDTNPDLAYNGITFWWITTVLINSKGLYNETFVIESYGEVGKEKYYVRKFFPANSRFGFESLVDGKTNEITYKFIFKYNK